MEELDGGGGELLPYPLQRGLVRHLTAAAERPADPISSRCGRGRARACRRACRCPRSCRR
jgi:hypothetical protein